jgi:sugar (pentulose or hexulose) kinase
MSVHESQLILAIDNGTQSVRALAFDLSGALVGKGMVALKPYSSPRPGWAEQDPEHFWDCVGQACARLWDGGVDPGRIAGVVVTTQRATVIDLDAEGRPLRPAIIWTDQRRAAPSPQQIPLKWRLLFSAFGMWRPILGLQAEAESNWLAQNEPEVWAAVAKHLLLSGYLNYRLTDRYVDSVQSQVGYVPFDYRKLDWAPSGDWRWPALAITSAILPELAQAGTIIGAVTPDAARHTGVPAGTPVIAGASDKACEVLGSGALTPEIGAISCGTAATLNVTSKRYFEALPFVPAYPAAIPGLYNAEFQVTRGFWMVSWFAQHFGEIERQRAEAEGRSIEAYFDDLLNATPPGADGLVLQPFWTAGVHEPGPEARGSMIGFTEAHTRAHLYRAAVEGLAFALRDGRSKIERRSKVRLKRLRVAGGGSQSNAVMQILADVFDLPAERPLVHEASGLGAAMIGAVALGAYKDFSAAAAGMNREVQTFHPIAANVERYEALYDSVYSKLYPALQPLFSALQRLP